ncbi:fructose-1,6-bisphosphatase/inositol monophosphatase family enzyme [Rhizobium sp. BK650]|nr:fructose-1,6-bisphosphatase/inositol monophosphatase family enzyme [Rhizobium sp. BK650]
MKLSTTAARLSPAASPRLLILAETALKAGETARKALRRRAAGEMVHKAARDYQTEIDVAVERIIVDEMTSAFPTYAIKGEEEVGNRQGGTDAPVIYIDPIDGTTNFAWGIPHFGMTISIAERDRIVAGVVYDAMQDELFSAEAGGGAWLNGEQIHCADVADIQNVLVGGRSADPRPGEGGPGRALFRCRQAPCGQYRRCAPSRFCSTVDCLCRLRPAGWLFRRRPVGARFRRFGADARGSGRHRLALFRC